MTPISSRYNRADARSADVVQISNRPVRQSFGGEVSNFSNVVCHQLGLTAPFSGWTTATVTLFLIHICDVIKMCAGPQMIRVYARRIVAFMKRVKAVREASFEQKNQPGCFGWRPTVIDLPVSIRRSTSLPLHAPGMGCDRLRHHPIEKFLPVNALGSTSTFAAHGILLGLSRGVGGRTPRRHPLSHNSVMCQLKEAD